MMYSTYEPTLIAPLVLGSEDGTSLCACQFTSGRDAAKFCWGGAERSDQAPVFCQARSWLDRYFAGEAPDPTRLCLAPRGTTFQQAVWEALLTIPYGQTVTYGWVARRVSDMRGSRTSPRAVGGAVVPTPSASSSPAIASWAQTEASRGLAGASRPRWPFLSTRALPSRGSRSPHAARRSRGSPQPSRPASRSSCVLAMSFSYTRSHIQGSLERAKISSSATQRTPLFSSGFLRRASEGSATNRYVTLR